MTKLIAKNKAKNMMGVDSVTYFFQDGFEYFVIDWVAEAFDTGKPEAMAFTANGECEITSWDELAVSYKDNAYEACLECLKQMLEKDMISNIMEDM